MTQRAQRRFVARNQPDQCSITFFMPFPNGWDKLYLPTSVNGDLIATI
jgi:hypothetical protein